MGKWHEVNIYPKGDCPCNGCQVGWASVSQKEEGGKIYQKFDDCPETCVRYKMWLKHKDRVFEEVK